ncbi:MAG: hypothetical protein F4X02_14025 [Chloroflexi bacterium]|nr:hypothetical protein [Chloroflexota bacterium]
MNRRLFLGIGFAVWLLATVVFRLAGQLFFRPDQPLPLTLLWLATAAAMVVIARLLFSWRELARAQRFEAAALLVAPGMALDAVAIELFVDVFPNMPPDSAGSFGAWLLIAYASVLIAAILPSEAN